MCLSWRSKFLSKHFVVVAIFPNVVQLHTFGPGGLLWRVLDSQDYDVGIIKHDLQQQRGAFLNAVAAEERTRRDILVWLASDQQDACPRSVSSLVKQEAIPLPDCNRRRIDPSEAQAHPLSQTDTDSV